MITGGSKRHCPNIDYPDSRRYITFCNSLSRLYYSKKREKKKRDSPIKGYRHQSEDASAYRENRDKLRNLAVERSKRPVTVEHVGVVEGDVQS